MANEMHLSPTMVSATARSNAIVMLVLINVYRCSYYLLDGVCNWSLFRYAVLSVLSSCVISQMRTRELRALLYLSFCCHVAVRSPCLFIIISCAGLQYFLQFLFKLVCLV